jgi:hypothetical protein
MTNFNMTKKRAVVFWNVVKRDAYKVLFFFFFNLLTCYILQNNEVAGIFLLI